MEEDTYQVRAKLGPVQDATLGPQQTPTGLLVGNNALEPAGQAQFPGPAALEGPAEKPGAQTHVV